MIYETICFRWILGFMGLYSFDGEEGGCGGNLPRLVVLSRICSRLEFVMRIYQWYMFYSVVFIGQREICLSFCFQRGSFSCRFEEAVSIFFQKECKLVSPGNLGTMLL